MRGRFLL
jgi:hypothetical protein